MKLKPNLKYLSEAMDWVKKEALNAGFSLEETRRIELVMEEALVNVIVHASLEEEDAIELTCEVNQGIIFSIKDCGPPFNPLAINKELKLSCPIEERKEGGLGIIMMKKFMDSLTYERKNNCNILKLQKTLTH